MQRSSLIATVIAAGGVLVAGSVASVAVIGAAQSSEVDTSTVALVSDSVAATAQPTAQASGDDSAPAPLPSASSVELPALPSDTPSAKPRKPKASPSSTPSTRPSARPSASASSSSDDDSTKSPSVSSSEAARSAVASSGGTVLGVSKASHAGYKAWAVRIQRADGSVVTGYVDRASGTVYDWVVNQAAPANAGGTSGNSGSGSYNDDDDEDENEDENEHESENEHDGDDD